MRGPVQAPASPSYELSTDDLSSGTNSRAEFWLRRKGTQYSHFLGVKISLAELRVRERGRGEGQLHVASPGRGTYWGTKAKPLSARGAGGFAVCGQLVAIWVAESLNR
jgi:hypothetical protein